ncbi:MAG: hypothetical protein AAF170_11995 [Bacteroidota bacterium]
MRVAVLLLTVSFLTACDNGLARPSDRQLQQRVNAATERLTASDAGQRVLDAIEAHGGLATWYSNGPVHFRFAYGGVDSLGQPTGDPLATDQTIDTWSARAVHQLVADTSVSFGWTGTDAWAMPNADAVPTNPRFWSLTPYYFVSMPFVLADEGVQLELADTLTVEGTTYDQVYVTFAEGTGDAPDDYYYLLVHPETNRVGGVRYVVSFAPYNPDGGHTPETIMLYDGAQTMNGITVQEGFRSFAWSDSLRGLASPKAAGTVTELAFRGDMPDVAFEMPTGAEVQPDI